MSITRWLFVLLFVAGLGFFATGMYAYASTWSRQTGDLASMQAAGRTAMHQLPQAGLGVLLLLAGALGLWRDRVE